jgi:hypothetical protein
MGKINTLKLKKELRSKFPKYQWYVREQRGGLSWSFAVYSFPEITDDERDKLRSLLGKYVEIDRDHATGEILGGGNTFVSYYGEKYW